MVLVLRGNLELVLVLEVYMFLLEVYILLAFVPDTAYCCRVYDGVENSKGEAQEVFLDVEEGEFLGMVFGMEFGSQLLVSVNKVD